MFSYNFNFLQKYNVYKYYYNYYICSVQTPLTTVQNAQLTV